MTKLKLFPSCSHILFSSLLSFFCRAEIVKLYSMIKTLDSVLKSDQENFVYRNFLNLVLFRAVYGFVSRLCVTRRDETRPLYIDRFHFISFYSADYGKHGARYSAFNMHLSIEMRRIYKYIFVTFVLYMDFSLATYIHAFLYLYLCILYTLIENIFHACKMALQGVIT